MQSRLTQLDVLRAVAIMLVLGRHFAVAPEQAGHFRLFAEVWYRLGWTGVDLFFVLSGFLIGGLIFKEIANSGTLDIKRFLIRRAFKIWPSYYSFLLVSFLILYYTHYSLRFCIHILWANLYHVQNFTMPHSPHTWSLAVEEHFYLALPLFMVVLCRFAQHRRDVLFLCCVGCVLIGCLAARVLLNSHRPYDDIAVLFPTYLRIDSLVFGVLLAWLNQFHAEQFANFARYNKALFCLGMMLISPMAYLEIFTTPFVWTWGFTLLYLGYGCILVSVFNTRHTRTAKFFASRPATVIARIGMYSYGIYLWHVDFVCLPLRKYFVHGFLGELPTSIHWVIGTALYIFAALCLGIILSRLIEWPALSMRDRFIPDKVALLTAQ